MKNKSFLKKLHCLFSPYETVVLDIEYYRVIFPFSDVKNTGEWLCKSHAFFDVVLDEEINKGNIVEEKTERIKRTRLRK